MEWKDEIVEEVRAARDAYAAEFDYDLKRIADDLKAKEDQRASRIVDLHSQESSESRRSN